MITNYNSEGVRGGSLLYVYFKETNTCALNSNDDVSTARTVFLGSMIFIDSNRGR